jgi:glycine reductase
VFSSDGSAFEERKGQSMEMKGKTVIALGERHGVSGTAIRELAKAAGAEDVVVFTECFGWAAGKIDLEDQSVIKQVAEVRGSENVVVLLGSPDADSASVFGETVVTGDPTLAGPLAGVALGLAVYHVVEDEVRGAVDPGTYEKEIGVLAAVFDIKGIEAAMRRVRDGA